MRTFVVVLGLASIAFASPAFSDVWSPAKIAKVKEQISVQEGRAAALQPIIEADATALDALLANAAALDQLATDEASKAQEYRNMAATAPNPKTQAEFIVLAQKLETFATRSEKSATAHHELAQALDETLQNLRDDLTRHLERAAELKTDLANNS
jgi:patatin-like phospholipase/acyl hydrolase